MKKGSLLVAAVALTAIISCSGGPSGEDGGSGGGSGGSGGGGTAGGAGGSGGVGGGSAGGGGSGGGSGGGGGAGGGLGADAGFDATLTYYWVTAQADYSGANDTIICNTSGQQLGTVPSAFASALRLEGTGRLLDGGLLNVGNTCTCNGTSTTCFVVVNQAQYPWGIGAGNRALVPYRSIAVDRNVIPLGKKVYAPALVGKVMPGSYGFTHDGCLEADDVGGGIVGAHVDFFVGEKSSYLTLDGQLGWTKLRVVVLDGGCP